MYSYCLEKIGINPKMGKFNVNRISLGIIESEIKASNKIKIILKEIEFKEPEIKITDILLYAEDLNYNPKLVLHILDNLKRVDIIFEPKKNVYRFLR